MQSCILAFYLLVYSVCQCFGGTVRILEGVDRKSDKDDNSLEYAEPDPMYGPRDLFFMKGSCFTNSFDRYEYTVCPFQNVTQRRTTAMKPQVIGIWGNWKTTTSTIHEHKGHQKNSKHANNVAQLAPTVDTEVASVISSVDAAHTYFNVMEYTNGRNCGQGLGYTTVYLECGHNKFAVLSVDSELNCEYALTLGLPLSCNLLRAD